MKFSHSYRSCAICTHRSSVDLQKQGKIYFSCMNFWNMDEKTIIYMPLHTRWCVVMFCRCVGVWSIRLQISHPIMYNRSTEWGIGNEFGNSGMQHKATSALVFLVVCFRGKLKCCFGLFAHCFKNVHQTNCVYVACVHDSLSFSFSVYWSVSVYATIECTWQGQNVNIPTTPSSFDLVKTVV